MLNSVIKFELHLYKQKKSLFSFGKNEHNKASVQEIIFNAIKDNQETPETLHEYKIKIPSEWSEIEKKYKNVSLINAKENLTFYLEHEGIDIYLFSLNNSTSGLQKQDETFEVIAFGQGSPEELTHVIFKKLRDLSSNFQINFSTKKAQKVFAFPITPDKSDIVDPSLMLQIELIQNNSKIDNEKISRWAVMFIAGLVLLKTMATNDKLYAFGGSLLVMLVIELCIYYIVLPMLNKDKISLNVPPEPEAVLFLQPHRKQKTEQSETMVDNDDLLTSPENKR